MAFVLLVIIKGNSQHKQANIADNGCQKRIFFPSYSSLGVDGYECVYREFIYIYR